ncbi:MAG: hypothetical protein ABJL99_00650 [Aliishimia sp.]
MSVLRYIFQRFSGFAAILGLTAWIVGTVLTWWFGEADTFQRTGALGVAASVLFFTDRLTQIELGRQRSVERLLHEYGVELAALRHGTKPQELPSKGFAVDFLTEERNFDELRRKADMFNFFNVVLITLATLQWGFGDRLINHFSMCGPSQC